MPNNPQKGSSIKVEPIKKVKDIQTIKKLLAGNLRNLTLFIIGINTNLRASDLVKIKVGDVMYLGPGESFEIREQKTKKPRRVTLNNACIRVVYNYLKERPLRKDEPLFLSGKGGRLTVQSVHRLAKDWCRSINLNGNYGSHTLRKTWGYHQRVTYGVDLPRLMVCFNHTTQRQTLDYLCIQPEEIKDVYENEL